MSYSIYKNLAWLNGLPTDEAKAAFLACCGSSEWARRMTAARPFPMLENLFKTADDLWCSLSPADWLEAFAAHPKIGSTKKAAAQNERAARWSESEQSGVKVASGQVGIQLAQINRQQDKPSEQAQQRD